MYWADKLIEDIKKDLSEKISSGKTLIVRDEKTMSGRVHVGSLRGVAIHGIVAQLLAEKKIKNIFYYELNDFDPMDDIPANLNYSKYKQYLGMPLYKVPAPEKGFKNFPEFYSYDFKNAISKMNFVPEFYFSSTNYKKGLYNDAIKKSLENANKIREIYLKISNSDKPKDWLPINIICESCGKLSTTKALNFSGGLVEYACETNLVEWTEGCGHKGKISPFDGNAKLPWKVEWAAKFASLDVTIEGEGKDLSTKGGARDVANSISREIFNFQPPFDIPYEHLVIGGKKMSSSKGLGASSREISDMMPANILRLLLLKTSYKKMLEFDPQGDTLPNLFDLYDDLASNYFHGENDDQKSLFQAIQPPGDKSALKERFLPRFTQVAYLLEMPHIDIEEEAVKMKGSKLIRADKKELKLRVKYAKQWLENFAPEKYKFKVHEDEVPESAQNLNEKQKHGIEAILKYVESQQELNAQELHTKIHDIKKELGANPREFFSGIYLSILGKESGPKVGWFLSVLDKDFLIKRFKQVI